MMGASSADLASYALDRPSVSFSCGVGIVTADFRREYLSKFVVDDPWLNGQPWQRRVRRWHDRHREAIVSTGELVRTSFHNDFGRRWGYTGGLTGIISGDGTTGSTINLCRSEHQWFGDSDGRLMRALMPHLQRGLQVHHRLTQADATTAASLESLELAGSAVLLQDAHGRVRHATTAGAALLRGRDGVLESKGALRATHRDADIRLQEAIASAIGASQSHGFGSGGRVTLPLESPDVVEIH